MELLNCPFCGSADVRNVSSNHSGPAYSLHANDMIFAVNCGQCGGSVPNRYDNDTVRAAWNRRAALAAPEAMPEPVAEVIPDVIGVEIVWTHPSERLPVGTKLYAHPVSAEAVREACAVAAEQVTPRHTECGNRIAAAIRALKVG